MLQKVSVITVNRNNAEGLEKTILSVINQTYKNFEYIVIDGASTDSSVDIIKKYSHYITYWCSEPDSGIYNAMNKGINKASGEYIIFMNSGDLFTSPNILYNIFSEKKEKDFLVGHTIVDGKRMKQKREIPDQITFYSLYTNLLSHQAVFTKKELFDELGLYDEKFKILADRKFILLGLSFYQKTAEVLNEYIALVEPGGISGRDDSAKLFDEEHEQILNKYFYFFLDDYKKMHKIRRFSWQYIKNHIIWRLRHILIN